MIKFSDFKFFSIKMINFETSNFSSLKKFLLCQNPEPKGLGVQRGSRKGVLRRGMENFCEELLGTYSRPPRHLPRVNEAFFGEGVSSRSRVVPHKNFPFPSSKPPFGTPSAPPTPWVPVIF
jgi:hypothetical protein